jgi:glycosyltransferase involved in cell wall biosynthesis
MNIVQIDAHLPWRGGEQQVLYLSQYLREVGCKSEVICQPHSALYRRAREADIPVKPLRIRGEIDLAAVWRLSRYLRRQRVDILHMHTPHDHAIGILAGMLAPKVAKVVSRRVDFPPMRHGLSRWKYSYPGVCYVAVSEAVRDVLISSGAAPSQVCTVHSGIDLRRFVALPTAPPLFPGGTRVVGTVGHLAGHKGHTYLLEAIRLLRRDEPHIGLVIAGDGGLRAALEAQAASLGITSQVRFTGFRHDILALMQQFEVFVFSSVMEGLGTAILDAMALRKPVVATRAGGIPEVVQDGVTGLLVPPREPEALAKALLSVLRQPEQSRAFGEAGRKRVEMFFTAERMAAHTLRVYRHIRGHVAQEA